MPWRRLAAVATGRAASSATCPTRQSTPSCSSPSPAPLRRSIAVLEHAHGAVSRVEPRCNCVPHPERSLRPGSDQRVDGCGRRRAPHVNGRVSSTPPWNPGPPVRCTSTAWTKMTRHAFRKPMPRITTGFPRSKRLTIQTTVSAATKIFDRRFMLPGCRRLLLRACRGMASCHSDTFLNFAQIHSSLGCQCRPSAPSDPRRSCLLVLDVTPRQR